MRNFLDPVQETYLVGKDWEGTFLFLPRERNPFFHVDCSISVALFIPGDEQGVLLRDLFKAVQECWGDEQPPQLLRSPPCEGEVKNFQRSLVNPFETGFPFLY